MHTYGRQGALAQSNILTRFLAALFFAGVTAACARIYFHVWFTPVPVTLQVLGVLLSGLVLGSRWGAVSQLQYLSMGAMGLPVFASPTAGPASFAGPSGGYLFGFVVGSFAAGWVFERLEGRVPLAAWIAGFAGIVGVYVLGAPWLGIWLRATSGCPLDECIRKAWLLGVVPFIGVDLLKAAVASSLALGGRTCRGLLQTFRSLG